MSCTDDLPQMEAKALELISGIQARHRCDGLQPDYATMREVNEALVDELRHALRNLYRRGLIEYHSTINGMPMFSLTHNENQ